MPFEPSRRSGRWPTDRPAVRGRRPGHGHRDVPQRLARVGGTRRHRLPARARPRARRRRRPRWATGSTCWPVGDRVTVPFVCGCGRCEWCLAGDAQVCPAQQQPGFTHWGSFAEHVALHAADTNLVAIPDEVDFATAASLGCRFATAYRALVGRARVTDGEWVTVVGAGGVGLSVGDDRPRARRPRGRGGPQPRGPRCRSRSRR